MSRKIVASLALLLASIVRLPAQSAIVTTLLTTQPPATLDDLTRTFPYSDYLRDVQFTDFATLQYDRYLIWYKYGDGDEFLYYLGDAFTRLYPVTAASLVARIEIGEAFLGAQAPGITPQNSEPYQIVGYFLLNGAARFIEREYRAKRFNPSAPQNAMIVQRLARDRIHLAFEATLRQKLAAHLRQRDYGYVARRARQFARLAANRVGQLIHRGAQSGRMQAVALTPVTVSPYGSFLQRNGVNDYEIAQLSERGRALGYALFLRRPTIRAQYIASNVAQRFSAMRKTGRLVAAFTGGFTNNFSEPEGFAVEQGRVVNAILMPDRHGLVLIERDGSVRTLNLKRDVIRLPLSPTTTLDIADPLTNLVSYSKLLRWARAQRATLFQTQLLAFGDSMLIDATRASARTAERRLLALTTDRATGAVMHVVFNMQSDQSLSEAAEKAAGILRARGLRIEALLNLDTGSQDVFFVYDDQGRNVRDARGRPIHGRRATTQTTSLLMYTF